MEIDMSGAPCGPHRAGANGHCALSFGRNMRFVCHRCIAALAAGGRVSALER